MKISMKNKKIFSHELLFVLYFWGFALLRPILQMYSNYSTYILLFFSLAILITSIYRLKTLKNPGSYILISTIVFILLFDLLSRPNEYTISYLYDFIIYGIIPVHLLSQVKEEKKLLNIYSWVSLIVFMLYFYDPFNDYKIFGNYMSFGFNMVLPAYFGLYIGRIFFKRRWVMVFEIICFLEIVVFANRSAILSVLILWIMMELFVLKSGVKRFFIVIITATLSFILFYYRIELLDISIALLSRFNLSSFSLVRIRAALMQNDITRLFSGRVEIWNLAQSMFSESILFGHGTGSFQSKFGFYTHNLYFDIIVQYGLIGLSGFLVLLSKAFRKIFISNGYTKIFGIFLFCIWFPKLFFSLYLFNDIGIWTFIAYGLINRRKATFHIYD